MNRRRVFTVSIAAAIALSACAQKKIEDMNLSELGQASGKEICSMYAPNDAKAATANEAINQVGNGVQSATKLFQIFAAASIIAKGDPDQSKEYSQAQAAALESCPTARAAWRTKDAPGAGSSVLDDAQRILNIRDKITKVLELQEVAATKESVANLYMANGTMPSSCNEISSCTTTVTIATGGRVIVKLDTPGTPELEGKRLVFDASLEASTGNLLWSCSTDADTSYVPESCRHEIPPR